MGICSQHHKELTDLLWESQSLNLTGRIRYTPETLIGFGGMASVFEPEPGTVAKVSLITQKPVKLWIPSGISSLHIDYLEKGEVILNDVYFHQLKRRESLNLQLMVAESEYLKQVNGSKGVVRYLGRRFLGVNHHILGIIEMERVEGESLADKLTKGNSLRHTGRVLYSAAEALVDITGRNIIHKDVKPDNLIVTPDDSVRILDFGIAQKLGGHHPTDFDLPDVYTLLKESIAERGTVMGSLGYSAPEQMRDEPLYPTTDWFSFALVVYEVLTGRMASDDIGEGIGMFRDEVHRKYLMKGLRDAGVGVDLREAFGYVLHEDPRKREPVHMMTKLRSMAGYTDCYDVTIPVSLSESQTDVYLSNVGSGNGSGEERTITQPDKPSSLAEFGIFVEGED